MGEPKKKGKGSTILLLLLLLLVAVGVAGYFKPDLPLIGPLVSGFFKKGAQGVDQSGVYRVTVTKAALDSQEFADGATIDVQVAIKRIDKEGKETAIWNSNQYGDRLAVVGKVAISAQWPDRPFDCNWKPGDVIRVEIWDYKGGKTKVAEWTSEAEGKEFPLKGALTVNPVKNGKVVQARKGATNQVVFEAKRTADYPAES
jgi:hypothetical protein